MVDITVVPIKDDKPNGDNVVKLLEEMLELAKKEG